VASNPGRPGSSNEQAPRTLLHTDGPNAAPLRCNSDPCTVDGDAGTMRVGSNVLGAARCCSRAARGYSATIPVPPHLLALGSRLSKYSIPASLSDSGSSLFPESRAACSSCPGPGLNDSQRFPDERLMRPRRILFAVIQATACGSGCGTGTPRPSNRFLAPGTSGDNG